MFEGKKSIELIEVFNLIQMYFYCSFHIYKKILHCCKAPLETAEKIRKIIKHIELTYFGIHEDYKSNCL